MKDGQSFLYYKYESSSEPQSKQLLKTWLWKNYFIFQGKAAEGKMNAELTQ